MKTKISTLVSSISIVAASFFVLQSAGAGKYDIARCVDDSGDITYTDFYCSTTENHNPMLMTEQAIDKPIRSQRLFRENLADSNQGGSMDTINSGAIASMRLTSVTSEAIDRCKQRFSRYFKRHNPGVSHVPAVEFDEITDRYVKGSNVSITVRASLGDPGNSTTATPSVIECTAQRFANSNEWKVGFLERYP